MVGNQKNDAPYILSNPREEFHMQMLHQESIIDALKNALRLGSDFGGCTRSQGLAVENPLLCGKP